MTQEILNEEETIEEAEVTEETLEETVEETVEEDDGLTVEEVEQRKADMKMIEDTREIVKKFFDEVVIKSELPFMAIEMIPDLLKGAISIHKGKSKKWEEVNNIQDDFYRTPINELEVYEDEDIEEDQE